MSARCGSILLLVGTVLMACTGGQTGDITQLTVCEQPRATVAVSTVPDGFSESLDALVAGALVQDASLQWVSGRAATRLDVGWTVASGSGAQPAQAQLLGEGNCPPQARVPVELDVRTLDGLLNETVLGQATLMADRSGYVIAEQPVAELTGTLDAFAELGLENDGADASLVWRINVSEPGSETGALYFRAAVEDETPLANW